jgi:hypothetical protein
VLVDYPKLSIPTIEDFESMRVEVSILLLLLLGLRVPVNSTDAIDDAGDSLQVL